MNYSSGSSSDPNQSYERIGKEELERAQKEVEMRAEARRRVKENAKRAKRKRKREAETMPSRTETIKREPSQTAAIKTESIKTEELTEPQHSPEQRPLPNPLLRSAIDKPIKFVPLERTALEQLKAALPEIRSQLQSNQHLEITLRRLAEQREYLENIAEAEKLKRLQRELATMQRKLVASESQNKQLSSENHELKVLMSKSYKIIIDKLLKHETRQIHMKDLMLCLQEPTRDSVTTVVELLTKSIDSLHVTTSSDK